MTPIGNNNNIGKYYKGTNTIRVGAEFRVTPQFSLRAGYNYVSTSSKTEFENANSQSANGVPAGQNTTAMNISTAGFNPSYTVGHDTQSVSFGLGYKTGGFYFDMAYVYKHQTATFNAFTPFPIPVSRFS